MAIFGIPQFTEVVASPDNSSRGLILPDTELGAPQSQNAFPERSSERFSDASAYAARGSANDATLGNPFDAPPNPFDRPLAEPVPDQQPFAGTDAGPGSEWTQPPAGQGSAPPLSGHSVATLGPDVNVFSADPANPAATTPATQLDWRAATRRLQELGIDDYHLERGESFDSFLFVCSFEPAGSTNVVMRFEAEADQPLAAVADVLDQIDRWLRRSFAESRQAALLSNGATP